MEAVIEELLEPRRIENRHHGIEEREFALVRHRRGLRTMVVASHDQHSAVARGAGGIGMAEYIARAVDARALAVPDAEDAVIGALSPHFGLLRAPECGCRQILIEACLELDRLGLEFGAGAHESLI